MEAQPTDRSRERDTQHRAQGGPGPAALARNQFYGHLYLGLYFEAQGNVKKSADYIAKATKDYETHGYMGQVVRVHHEWLANKKKLAKQKTD